MKKIFNKPAAILIAVLLALSGMITVSALSGGNLFNGIQEMGDEFVANGSVIKIIDKASLDAASKNITKTYTSADMKFLALTESGGVMGEVSIAPRSLYAVNRFFPIEHLRKVSDSLIYAVYKIKDADMPEYYMYLFFERFSPEGEAARNTQKDMEKWFLTDRVFFVSQTLQMKDFYVITTGSSYADVLKIDPLTAKYRPRDVEQVTQEVYDFDLEKYVTKTYTPDPVLSYQAYHYVNDGIVCVTFEREDINSDFVVKNIGYNDTFELPSKAQKGTVIMKINNIDLPRN